MTVKCVVTLPAVSGFPEDACTNTFSFIVPAGFPTAPTYEQLTNAIAEFYNFITSTTNAIASFMGPSLSRAANACSVDVYDVTGHLNGSPHGSPVYTDLFTLAGDEAGQELPREAALALTLRGNGWASQLVEEPDDADPGDEVQRPRQRYTGKVYLGPWKDTSDAESATGNLSIPSTALRTTILDSAENLFDDLSVLSIFWSTWSRSDAAMRSITDVQIDDAWDTQRRRGGAPVTRTTRNLA